MFDKCVECDKLGKDCIPNLYVMSADEIREWAIKMKYHKGWSNAELSRRSGVAKGTIDSTLSVKPGENKGVNYSTFAPMLCALIECIPDKMPCKIISEENEFLSEQVKILAEENANLLKMLSEYKDSEEKEIADIKQEYNARTEYFKEQLKWRKQLLIVAVIVACGALALICSALIIDWFNGAVGFFWYYE